MLAKRLLAAGTVLAALAAAAPAQANDPASCQTVRFSDVGWTDITATTAATSVVLSGLGYQPKTQILSVPVTYASLKNGDIDVFLGNWMPTMEGDLAAYGDDGSVAVLTASRTSPTSPSSRTNWTARSTASSRATTVTV